MEAKLNGLLSPVSWLTDYTKLMTDMVKPGITVIEQSHTRSCFAERSLRV